MSEGDSVPGWPSTATLIPFGDIDGDRRNDILVRFSSGELRVYRPGFGTPIETSPPHHAGHRLEPVRHADLAGGRQW
ncbi:hypothetical protein E4K10_22695 [Streptomyces sp. T1317-0309]|nr:hypothetical protein E4K10_22695 [Streptomyces sp. T1317-0309]